MSHTYNQFTFEFFIEHLKMILLLQSGIYGKSSIFTISDANKGYM